MVYPIIYRFSTIPGGAGFLPSTVRILYMQIVWWCNLSNQKKHVLTRIEAFAKHQLGQGFHFPHRNPWSHWNPKSSLGKLLTRSNKPPIRNATILCSAISRFQMPPETCTTTWPNYQLIRGFKTSVSQLGHNKYIQIPYMCHFLAQSYSMDWSWAGGRSLKKCLSSGTPRILLEIPSDLHEAGV